MLYLQYWLIKRINLIIFPQFAVITAPQLFIKDQIFGIPYRNNVFTEMLKSKENKQLNTGKGFSQTTSNRNQRKSRFPAAGNRPKLTAVAKSAAKIKSRKITTSGRLPSVLCQHFKTVANSILWDVERRAFYLYLRFNRNRKN